MNDSEIDVIKDFGASGDGVTDDAPAIQAAIFAGVKQTQTFLCTDEIRPFGAILIRFPTPKRFYRLRNGLVVPNGRPVALVGTCPGAVLLRLDPDSKPDFEFTPPLPFGNDPGHIDSFYLKAMWKLYVNYVRARFAIYFSKQLLTDTLEAKTGSPHPQMVNSAERLTLVGGGILIGGHDNNRLTAIRDCTIRCAADGAVKAEDQTVTTVDISRCIIEDCGHGVNIAFGQCDFWTLNHCRFARNSGIDLLLGSSGCHVYDTEFRDKVASATGKYLPFVQIKEGPGAEEPVPFRYKDSPNWSDAIRGSAGNNRFTDCRFGDSPNPPVDLVVIGPDIPDGTQVAALPAKYGLKDTYVSDVQFDGCVFGGPGYSYSERPRSMLRLTVPCQGLQIVGCAVWDCKLLVSEHAVEFGGNAVSGQSYGNSLEYLNVMGRIDRVFSQGGRGFEIIGQVARDLGHPEPDPSRPSTNLLRGADAGWPNLTEAQLSSPPGKALDGLKATVIAPGPWPTGIEAPGPFAWELLPSPNAPDLDELLVAQRLDLDTTDRLIQEAGGGPAVFSVWLRKGQLSRFTMDVAWEGHVIGGGTGGNHFSTMAEHWERFEILVERVPTVEEIKAQGGYSKGPAVRIWVGNHLLKKIKMSEPAFSLAMLQLEVGRAASPFSPSLSIELPRGPRRFQYLALGGHVIESAASEPKLDDDGWHGTGDAVFDTHPTSWRGWVCTQPGAPGTWKRFGSINS